MLSIEGEYVLFDAGVFVGPCLEGIEAINIMLKG